MGLDLVSTLTRTVRWHAGAIESWEGPVREDADDAVHQMRVSSRTLRSVVQVYGTLFAPTTRDEINGTLRRLGRHLATVRDAEVLLDLARERVEALPIELAKHLPDETVERLVGGPEKEHTAARAHLIEVMGSPAYADDIGHIRTLAGIDSVPLADGLTPEQLADAAATLAPFVAGRMDDMATMAKGVAADGEKRRNEQLHELRKEAKRVRYAVSAVRDATGLELDAELTARMRTAKKLQTALGRHRDSVMLTEHLLRTAKKARAKGEDTFGYGVLHAREHRVRAKALRKATRQLDRLLS